MSIALAAAFLLGVSSWTAARADEDSNVEKCSRKLGTIAVSEPQNGTTQLQQYGLGSPTALLRLMIQQSGCFDAVERGAAMQNLQQERALAAQGEMRQDANIGKGQLQAADFVMTTNLTFAGNTGGVNADTFGLGRLIGRTGIGALAGGVKFKEAQTSLLIADVRSGIQVAAAEGNAKKTDFNLSSWGYGRGVVGAVGGYTSTPEGKIIAASLLDNYNHIVISIRDKDSLIKSTSRSSEANAANSTRALTQPAGQMMAAKIANVKVYEEPRSNSRVIATLRKTDELVATGEAENGFIKVDAANFSGWVQRSLVAAMSSGSSEASPPPAAERAPIADAGSLPRGFAGTFAGNFYGPDQGDFNVVVASNGIVAGTGRSSRTGGFGISGNVAPNGAVQMNGAGQAGAAQFIGTIDPYSGRLNGSWYYNGVNQGGNFTGQRQ